MYHEVHHASVCYASCAYYAFFARFARNTHFLRVLRILRVLRVMRVLRVLGIRRIQVVGFTLPKSQCNSCALNAFVGNKTLAIFFLASFQVPSQLRRFGTNDCRHPTFNLGFCKLFVGKILPIADWLRTLPQAKSAKQDCDFLKNLF